MKSWLLTKLQNLPFIQKKAKANPIPPTDEGLSAEQELWWGSFLIEEEQSRFFKIGTDFMGVAISKLFVYNTNIVCILEYSKYFLEISK